MKKLIVSAFVIVAFGFYVFFARSQQSTSPVATTSTASTTPSAQTSTTTSTTSTATTQATTSAYKDGSYTGTAADAYYGNVQVRAVISGGKLADIVFLQYPSDHRESLQINEAAMPVLKQEAIKAQTAQIDGVSGATDTSGAFIESLSSALSLAHS